jgi:hypothetical protein
MVPYVHACTCYVFDESLDGAGADKSSTFNPGGAPRPFARRVVGVGGAGPVPLRLRQPGARTGRARGRLHARRPVSPVQGQGGAGPGGAGVGQPDLVARGGYTRRATARPGRCAAGAGARSRRLLPPRCRPRHDGAQGRVQRSGPSGWARDQACFKNAGQALRQPDRRGAQGRVDPTWPAGQGGCAGLLGSARRGRDRARRASPARRTAGRPRGRRRARAGESGSTPTT